MKLLILGESDSIGMALTDPFQGWGHRIPVELEHITSEAPETTHVRFYPWAGDSATYLEGVLARGPFDSVVISASKAPFTMVSADNRVRKVFGDRAGNLFKASVSAFDSRTRRRKPPGLRRKLNALTHKAGRRLIGQAPGMTAVKVAEDYFVSFARLARLEDARVLVVAAPPLPSSATTERPNLTREVEWFRGAIRDEAKRRHFTYFDAETLMPPPGAERDALFIDAVHKTPAFHGMIGRAIAEVLSAKPR